MSRGGSVRPDSSLEGARMRISKLLPLKLCLMLGLSVACSTEDQVEVQKSEAKVLEEKMETEEALALFGDPEAIKASIDDAVCVFRTMYKLGVHTMYVSDPAIMESVLSEDMYMGDLDSARSLVEDSLDRPISLWPMIREIRKGILEKQPEVVQFLCEALV